MSDFCTSIHCMDGRIQEPIIRYLKARYRVKYVDTITEPGPCGMLAGDGNSASVDSILKRVEISIHKHHSEFIVVSGHHDCAGNPCDKEVQTEQIKKSVATLAGLYPGIQTAGLWIDDGWKVIGV